MPDAENHFACLQNFSLLLIIALCCFMSSLKQISFLRSVILIVFTNISWSEALLVFYIHTLYQAVKIMKMREVIKIKQFHKTLPSPIS